jgi:hypothetical protein
MMMIPNRTGLLRAAAFAGILALGCTKSASGPTTPTTGPAALTTIIVSPSSDTLVVFATQLFTAVGKDGAGNVLALTPTWSMANGDGTVNAAGLFTAGGAPGTSVVKVQSGTISAFAAVTVTPATTPPGTLASITVTPNPVTLVTLGIQQFTAVGKDGVGDIVAFTPTWSVAAGAGAISSTGLFTAGVSPGSSSVQASVGSLSAVATVVVVAPAGPLQSITVTPYNPYLYFGGVQQFSAAGHDAQGNAVATTVTWSVPGGGGTINAVSGLFTAGTSPGQYLNNIKATSGTVSGYASVSVSSTTLFAFITEPGTTPVGQVITPAVRVVAQDSLGNTLTTFNGAVTIVPGGSWSRVGTVAGTLTVSALNGIATFSDLRVGQPGLGWALAATAPGFAYTQSAYFAVTAATPRRLAFVEGPVTSPVGRIFRIQVAVEDSIGNTVVTYAGPITLRIGANPGGATQLALSMPPFAGPGTTSGFDPGIANFGSLGLDKAGVGYTLVATADGLESATSVTFDITP